MGADGATTGRGWAQRTANKGVCGGSRLRGGPKLCGTVRLGGSGSAPPRTPRAPRHLQPSAAQGARPAQGS